MSRPKMLSGMPFDHSVIQNILNVLEMFSHRLHARLLIEDGQRSPEWDLWMTIPNSVRNVVHLLVRTRKAYVFG